MADTEPYGKLTAEQIEALKEAAQILQTRDREDRDLVFGSRDWESVQNALAPFAPDALPLKAARVLTDGELEALAHARQVAAALTPIRTLTLEQVRILNEALRPFKGKSPREVLEEQLVDYLGRSVGTEYRERARKIIELVSGGLSGDQPKEDRPPRRFEG